jgi:DNA-binding CsgD family transcriptional regulator
MRRREFLVSLAVGLVAGATGGLLSGGMEGDRASAFAWRLHRLSPREREVLALLKRGWSDARIGRELALSPHTVRNHVQTILFTLETASRPGRADRRGRLEEGGRRSRGRSAPALIEEPFRFF